MDLPPRQSVPSNLFQDFTGGGYFYLDERDRAVIPTTTRHIFVVGETAAPGFRIEHDYDVSGSARLGRQDHLGAARLVGAHLVRDHQGRRRNRRPGQRRR